MLLCKKRKRRERENENNNRKHRTFYYLPPSPSGGVGSRSSLELRPWGTMATLVSLVKLAAMSPGLQAAGEVPSREEEEEMRLHLGGPKQ